ncbi:amidohydrolase family protein [Hymenobacter taeanensis]|uniref:Amidohydrolase family protein n=1 Tax=Hymenobacter taeanensis TaxID=2735321 RepID=A0A6M6BKA4_9BACT|nr:MULTISPECIES: amidohydrolase family protein [Hymenobacter]QJX47783.1 amidohydrolase family protein [Hymenobacter taeanensis]UOQ82729.1 amidohydrolase family protein [Hymenobacter sp. 5414T-23]
MRISALLLSLGLLTAAPALAQVPAPAPPQSKPMLLVGGTLHVGNGTVVPDAAVAFDKGKITYAGAQSGFSQDKAGYEVVDVKGQEIYPGLILPNTTLGLTEVEAIRATVDAREVGILNPNVRSIIAYNTDSDILPTVRTNGVLLAQVTPRGGMLSGQSSVVQLDAWNWQDAAVKADDGLHLNWPQMVIKTNPAEDQKQVETREKNRTEQLRQLESLLSEASAYRQQPASRKENLRLTALAGLFDGSKTLFIHTDYGKEIVESVRFAKRLGVQKVTLVGARDAWMMLDFLKQNDVAVILSRIHALPRREGDDYDLPYKLPSLLQQAGVRFCLDYEGDQETSGSRNLAFIAGTAAGHGLTKEQALTAITLSPARILGLDKDYGSLEAGKSATLVVSRGDLLDMRTNDVTQAYIDGRAFNLNNKQTYLRDKFKAKYGQR